MNKKVGVLFITLLLLFSQRALCSVYTTKDKVLAGLEQFSAVFATSALVAQQAAIHQNKTDQESIQCYVAKVFVDAARLFNGIVSFYNQYAYMKNFESGGKKARMSFHAIPWIGIDSIKFLTNFLPQSFVDRIENINFLDTCLTTEAEKGFYQWLENNPTIQKLKDYVLPSIEAGAMLWSAADYNKIGENDVLRKLYLSEVKGMSRSLQGFCNAPTITLKRGCFFLFLVHLCFFCRDYMSPPTFGGDTCHFCVESLELQREKKDLVKLGCCEQNEFHSHCMSRSVRANWRWNCPFCRAHIHPETFEVL